MENETGPEVSPRRQPGRTVSVLVFILMSVVSTVILLTEEKLGAFDYVLIFGAPFALSAFSYFVVFYHDPKASD